MFVHINVESTLISGWNNLKKLDLQHLSRIKSRFLRSGEVILHTGFFRKCTSSCHTYCPGAGVQLLFLRFGALAVPSWEAASKAWEGVLWTESSTKTKLSSSFAFRRPIGGEVWRLSRGWKLIDCWSRSKMRPQGWNCLAESGECYRKVKIDNLPLKGLYYGRDHLLTVTFLLSHAGSHWISRMAKHPITHPSASPKVEAYHFKTGYVSWCFGPNWITLSSKLTFLNIEHLKQVVYPPRKWTKVTWKKGPWLENRLPSSCRF